MNQLLLSKLWALQQGHNKPWQRLVEGGMEHLWFGLWLSLWLGHSECVNRSSSMVTSGEGRGRPQLRQRTQAWHPLRGVMGYLSYRGEGSPHRSQTSYVLPHPAVCIKHQCLNKFLQTQQSHPLKYYSWAPYYSKMTQSVSPSCQCPRLQMNKQETSCYIVPY